MPQVDLFANTVGITNDIDVINKDIDPSRQDTFEMAQLFNVMNWIT